MENEPSNLPAEVTNAIVAIPRGLVPSVVKAVDRLLGAAVDIPVAWLEQKKSKIDAQTESYKLVEATIARSVVSSVGDDPEIGKRALNVLVNQQYRKQVNREAVAAAMISEIKEHTSDNIGDETTHDTANVMDDDWLNVFERYAEDASNERLQGLWGRVLSGEIRNPGSFSMRTLRFLSEFSQKEAVIFENFAQSVFGDHAPKKLVRKNNADDIADLIHLEHSDLVSGATGNGLLKMLNFNNDGYCTHRDGNDILILFGKKNTKFSYPAIALTALGEEVLKLITNRKLRDTARTVAFTIRSPEITAAALGVIDDASDDNRITPVETLWGTNPQLISN